MSAKSPDDSPESSSRRDRAAIAAQACQTCRSRKSKCDEQRPKCGLCSRLGVDCVYREPQPTKKDKTLVHILSILERVESKVDRINLSGSSAPGSTPSHGVESAEAPPHAAWAHIADQMDPRDPEKAQGPFPSDLISATSHLTAAHRVLLWPSVYILLTRQGLSASVDMQQILTEGTSWFTHLELEKHAKSLPSSPYPPSPRAFPASPNPVLGIPGLTTDMIRHLADAYFDTFNILAPILDRETFYSDFIGPLLRGSREENDVSACIALLVTALGSVAIEGATGPPIEEAASSSSGFRGGSVKNPPGLEIFNQARRRMGFVMNMCTLENVQIYLLQATYYESCSRHMDFWRSCAAASMAFQVYIRCEHIDWAAPEADIIKRVYWTCILNEDLYHLELDLPRTGIYNLEDQIPLPSFSQTRSISSNQARDESPHYHYHFLSMIALRRLIARIHASLHSDTEAKTELSSDWPGPPTHVVKELARQLEAWRTYLPQPLQWTDHEALSWPNVNPLSNQRPALFTATSHSPGADNGPGQRFNFDIVTAHMRTRFYYARYMIYRTFVFKALHFPEEMTPEDVSFCALAIQSMCLWPICMAPCRDKKRLVPHLFTWTQNFVGMLLIFRMIKESALLDQIARERVNYRDMNLTVELLIDWIKDVQAVDGVAAWSWKKLEPLYHNIGPWERRVE